MPTNWIVRPHHEDIAEFSLYYERKAAPGSGFGLPCDKHGNIIGDAYRTLEDRQAQGAELLCNPNFHGPVIQDLSRSWFNPGAIRCQCGRRHDLQRGDSQCECGQLFNACGQALLPEHLWEERYEEDV